MLGTDKNETIHQYEWRECARSDYGIQGEGKRFHNTFNLQNMQLVGC